LSASFPVIARELGKDAGLVGDSKRREAVAAQRV
jgi:hypothetical protein